MNFSEALDRMRNGAVIRRKIWAPNVHIFSDSKVIRSCPGGITEHIHGDNILAEDWEVVTPRENCACVTHFRMPPVKLSEQHPDTARLNWILGMLFKEPDHMAVPIFMSLQRDLLWNGTWADALVELRKNIDERISK